MEQIKYIKSFINQLSFWLNPSLLKKTIEPCPKQKRKCKGFNGYNGNCIGFNGNYNYVYCYVILLVGLKNVQNTLQKVIL